MMEDSGSEEKGRTGGVAVVLLTIVDREVRWVQWLEKRR